jgi:hypothetical protein
VTANVVIKKNFKKVEKVVEDQAIHSFSKASFEIRKFAKASILRRKKNETASPPGMPPRTRSGQLPRAIFYDVDKQRQEAIIGPIHSRVGLSAEPMEHGGVYKGHLYDQRPFMSLALQKIVPRLPSIWRYSIK